MAHEVETMFSAREVPWHGLGEVTEDVLTAGEAIKAAGLDWDVELRDVFVQQDDKKIVVPGHHAVVRDMDQRVLGMVKSRYVPFQNREAFAFADNLVDSGEAKYETAGSLRDGRQVFLTMKVPTEIKVDGGNDAHELYILLRTAHDGTKAISVYLTPIRVVCMNTLALATHRSNVRQKWSMPHVSNIEGKLAEARETLRMSFDYADEFSRMANDLINTMVSDDMAVKLLEEVFPVRPRTDEKIEGVMDALRNSNRNGYHGTGWGLLNAVTEYHEHYRDRIQPEATFHNTVDGEIAGWRNKLTSRLLGV